MNDSLFRLLAALIFITGAAVSIYYRRRADRQSAEKVLLKEEGLAITITLRLAGLLLWSAVFAYLLNPAWVGWSRVDLPEWARWLGTGMGIAADALAFWIFRSLGNNVSPTVVTREKHSLVTSGPYRWVRHPLYSMGMLAYLGFALLAENWFIALLAVIVFIILAIRTPKEEARLLERFSDEYRAYQKRTGRYLPMM